MDSRKEEVCIVGKKKYLVENRNDVQQKEFIVQKRKDILQERERMHCRQRVNILQKRKV